MRTVPVIAASVLFAGILAGCGGSSLTEQARQESKQLLGDGHPRLISVETVRDIAGNREAVITMQGHFKPAVGCTFGSCRPFSYAVLDFTLPNPSDSQGFSTISLSQWTAITHAKNARAVFSIFPDFTNPAIRCAIPRGGSFPGTIPGACLTNYETTDHTVRVEFKENWPLRKRTNPGLGMAYKHSGGWTVTLDHNGRVQSIRVTGHLPPQLWK
jgi:hypothetical protein